MAGNVKYRNETENLMALAETIYLCTNENGLTIPICRGRFILERAEYEVIKLRLDEFYLLTPSEDIQSHNDEILSRVNHVHEQTIQSPTPTMRKSNEWEGYIYVIQSGGYYKIGRTKDMKTRMKAFESSLPAGFDLVCSWYTTDTRGDEARVHSIFAKNRINGEWFDLKSDDVERLRDISNLATQRGIATGAN